MPGPGNRLGLVNASLTDAAQLDPQVDGFSLFAIGRWRRRSRTPELTPVFCWLCPRGLDFSFKNDQARSERSGRAVGVSASGHYPEALGLSLPLKLPIIFKLAARALNDFSNMSKDTPKKVLVRHPALSSAQQRAHVPDGNRREHEVGEQRSEAVGHRDPRGAPSRRRPDSGVVEATSSVG
jgi:hypothetical protein